MKVEIKKALKKALKTGNVHLGSKRTVKSLENNEAKLVLLAANCPEDLKAEVSRFNIPLIEFEGTNVELGAICGKPYSIASLAVIEPGESDIMNAIEKDVRN